jgi:hypothetical protein
MKRLIMLIPLVFLCCFGCQEREKVAEQPSSDMAMDTQMIKDRVEELEAATDSVDPIIGKWKLNIAESKILGDLPKEFTESYQEIDGNLIELTTIWIDSDGSSYPETFTFPAQGGVNTFLTPISEGRHEIETLIAPGEWFMTGMQDGKQTTTRHKVVSKDGKTMRHTIRHTDSDGKISEESFIFDRQ